MFSFMKTLVVLLDKILNEVDSSEEFPFCAATPIVKMYALRSMTNILFLGKFNI